MAMLRGEQKDCLAFEKRQGESSGQMNLKIEVEKGNKKRDKNKASVEEASRLLLKEFFLDSDHDEEYVGNQYELENACEQMAFKLGHIEVGSEGSTRCLDKDVAKDCIKGVTTCPKCLHDRMKSSTKKHGRLQYTSHKERYANGVRFKSNVRKHGSIQYKSHKGSYANGVRSRSNDEKYERIQFESHKERYANGVRSKSNVEKH